MPSAEGYSGLRARAEISALDDHEHVKVARALHPAHVRVLVTGLATYPDVSVVCGPIERDPDDPDAITNPSVLVEVLSASTEGYDRGAKFAHFRELPSLRDYVLVSQYERRVEVYSRDAQGLRVLREARAGGEVPLSD